jgi:micrococcal nuclease
MIHFRKLNAVSIVLVLPMLAIAGQYQVIRVIDGDTIVIRYDGKFEKVRLLCVNTPESVHPDKKQNIPMGKIASNYTRKKLIDEYGQYIDLEFEIDRIRGNHGRLLAYVFVNGKNLNIDLVRQG